MYKVYFCKKSHNMDDDIDKQNLIIYKSTYHKVICLILR